MLKFHHLSKIWLISPVLLLSACVGIASGENLTPDGGAILEETEPVPTRAVQKIPTSDSSAASRQTATPPAVESTPLDLLPDETPPLGAENQFSTDFSRHTVPYAEILSGGPPKDGIPAVDDPKFIRVEEADEFLADLEPVIFFQVGDDVRSYPLQILTWHEIVNDVVGGVPVAVTFCPLCNTAIAFESTFDGQMLDFGTTGRLRYSNLIMYDRQTETWWQQATGTGIAGKYAGSQLAFLPAPIVGWAEIKENYPEARVLSKETGFTRPYGQNPYQGYDNINNTPFLFRGPATPGQLPAMARVLTVDLNQEAVAYPYDVLQEQPVINDTRGGQEIVIFWQPGTTSALDALSIVEGKDVGAGASFSRQLDGGTLSFSSDGQRILDDQTGSQWDVFGRAVSGELAGSQLEPVVSINHFWFSWAAFRPDTRIYED
jgi:hypothetical protein